MVNKNILIKTEKYARKLWCFQLPITIQVLLRNQHQLAQLQTYYFHPNLISMVDLHEI